ncbi:hypothetical protein V493_06467 [Pseudogymnoascus sp. VKM F-4281 (FW-2241)]|nr:hypothetical protein V493_06467 [Pseudogymnoascus sp. VKM F-4281 (FW-2241)]
MEQTFAEAPKPGQMHTADGPEGLNSSQFPECAPARSKAEIEVYMDLLRNEGGNTTPGESVDRVMELPQDRANSLRFQLPSLPDDQFPAQTQQARLFDDPRRHKLFGEYNEVIRQDPDAHLARLGELAHYVFDNGRPARVWTAGGVGSAQVGLDPSTISIHGRCNCTYDEADILLLTESEHAAWSRANNPPKLVVIRDPEFSQRRPAKSTESWLREQEKRTHKKWVDVQRLDRKCDNGAAENIPLRDAIQQWRTSQDSDAISLETPPMNLLNISDKTVGHWPEGLAKDYQLLFEAIDECEGMIYRSLDERLLPLSEQDRGIGKTTLMLFSHSDIQKCTQFRILAHRGACSSWHIDNAGVYTFIILEGNIDSLDEEAEDVVKYWPVYPTHHMSAEDEHAARLGFSKEGINWRPKPDTKIPVIALTRGDMLIQPPGTIHAPITLTNCFFLGGMAWRKNTLPQTLNVWYYLMKNEICTNEPLPRQSQAILDFIRVAVHDAPEEHGYRKDELAEFDKICNDISGMVSRCGCTKRCSLSTKCSCLMQALKCGNRCHKNSADKTSALDPSTCTTANMLSPSSLSEGKKYAKRSRLRGDEDSDYTSNSTPAAKIKRKKRAVETLQAKSLNATLDATLMLPGEHLNGSPVVAGSKFTSMDTRFGKTKGEKAVEAPEVKALDATALLPNVSANSSSLVADSAELKRPEICPESSTGGTCEYDTQVRNNRLVCKHCSSVVELDGESIELPRSRAGKKYAGINENGDTRLPSIEKGAPHEKKCEHCPKTGIAVCSACRQRLRRAQHKKEANNEAATPATVLPSIEKGASYQRTCGHCRRFGILVDRRGPDGPGTLCTTCGKKYSKENPLVKTNNKREAPAEMGVFDKAKATSDTVLDANRNTPSKHVKSETPEAPRSRSHTPKEGYCQTCQATVLSFRWYNHEGASGKGRRCGKCYQSNYGKIQRERRRSLAVVENAPPSPAKENETIVLTGLKMRFSPSALSVAKSHNADGMDKDTAPPIQLQSGILPPPFGASPGLLQDEGAIYAPKTNLRTTTKPPIAAEPQESTQQELAMEFPLQHTDPEVLIDLQSVVSQEASPEQSIEHKSEANGLLIPKLDPQTRPALTEDNADVPLKPLNTHTEPEAVPEPPVTNRSTTPESLEHNPPISSPLTAISDGFSDREDAWISSS